MRPRGGVPRSKSPTSICRTRSRSLRTSKAGCRKSERTMKLTSATDSLETCRLQPSRLRKGGSPLRIEKASSEKSGDSLRRNANCLPLTGKALTRKVSSSRQTRRSSRSGRLRSGRHLLASPTRETAFCRRRRSTTMKERRLRRPRWSSRCTEAFSRAR